MPIRSHYGIRSKDREVRELKQHMNIPAIAGGGGVTDHGALTGLGDDDHANYVHLTAARSIQAQHTYSPVSPAAPFALAANAQGQLVTGLKADQLDKDVIAGAGLITGGTLTSDVTIAIATANTGIIINANSIELALATTSGLSISSGLLVGAGDGINVLANSIEVDVTDLIGAGLVEIATNNIGHDTGDFGDMHTNYAEHDQTESITGAWTFSANDVTINGVDLVFAVASRIESTAGNITIAPAGDLILDPVGNDVLPNTNYDINLGALSKKYLTLYAAELWVETLVAQNTIATIGGRILVGPTTTLTSDIGTGDTTIYVKHNQMVSGDRVYMESNGKVEFMAITSAPGGVGPYSYTVTRDLDLSGANLWYAGDAVFNTGQTGDGFMDLYSYAGVTSGTVGPTIVGNVRNSGTYNDWSEHWAIGNLNGLYGYSVDTYGVALGEYGEDYITIDGSHIKMFGNGGVERFKLDGTNGVMYLGYVAGYEYLTVSSTGIAMYSEDTSTAVKVFNLDAAGNLTLGRVATNYGNAYWNNATKRLEFRGGVDGEEVQAYINTDGKIYAGAGVVEIGLNGIRIESELGGTGASAINFYGGAFSTLVSHISSTYSIGGGGSKSLELTLDGFSASDQYISLVSLGALWDTLELYSDDYITLETADRCTVVRGKGMVIDGVLPTANFPTAGELQVGDRIFIYETANSEQVIGLTINQGGNDDEIISLKSSDVAHAMTDITETDTFLSIRKFAAGSGGSQITAFSDATLSIGLALSLRGICNTQYTGKTNTSTGAVTIEGMKKNGTTAQSLAANGNVFVVKGYSATHMIVDEDGEIHSRYQVVPGDITDFNDEYDDLALLNGLRASLQSPRVQLDNRFNEFITYAKPILESTGVVTYNDDGHHFIAHKRLMMLTIDAVRQLGDRIERYEEFLLGLGYDPKLLN